jgi:hypothetical protein
VDPPQGRPRGAATLRIYSFGRELRITVGGEMVFGRLLRDDHDQRLVDDILRTFLGDGWVPALSA